MKIIKVTRDLFFDQQASLGTFYVYEGANQLLKCESLERGWVDNKNMISCIPEGDYKIVFEFSDKFKTNLWEIKGVQNRSECKIHSANYFWQLNGCIALGNNRKYLDGDTIMDVTSSKITIDKFHNLMGNDKEAVIQIRNILNI